MTYLGAKRRLTWAVLPLVVAVPAGCFAVLSAEATTSGPATAGWWWTAQQTPAQLPGPTYVAAGELLVEGTPAGRSAVAAVRIPVAPGQRADRLVLSVRSIRGAASVVACPSLSGWAPAVVGTWAYRPECGGPGVPLGLSSDGATLSAPAGTLLRGSATSAVLDIVLVPAVTAATGTTIATSVTLVAPTTAALTTQPLPALTRATEPAEIPAVFATGPQSPPAPTPATITAVGALPVAQEIPLLAQPEALPRVAPVSAPTKAAALTALLALPTRPDGARRTALLVLLGIAVGAAALLQLGGHNRRTHPMAQTLGVGRFRSPRTGNPFVRL